MKVILNRIKKFLNILNQRQLSIQSTLFLVFAITSFFVDNSNNFWMFIICSILFSGLQRIIDELESNNKKNKL